MNLNLTLKQVEAFLAVAQLDGFTRAAERIHLTQSAISGLIRELESQLGVRLFDRTTRAVELTEAGKEFLPFAEKAVNELQSGLHNARDLLAKKRGRLVLAAPPMIASNLLPPVIAGFREHFPGVSVVLKDLLADEIVTRVKRGEVDFGIGTFHHLDEEIASTPVITDYLSVVCPKGHALTKKARVRWKDMDGFPMVGLDRHSSLRHLVDRHLESAGCVAQPAFEVSFVTTAIGLVQSGLGVCILPSYALVSTRDSRTQARRLVDPVVTREISIITKHGRSFSPAAEGFADFLAGHIKTKLGSQSLIAESKPQDDSRKHRSKPGTNARSR